MNCAYCSRRRRRKLLSQLKKRAGRLRRLMRMLVVWWVFRRVKRISTQRSRIKCGYTQRQGTIVTAALLSSNGEEEDTLRLMTVSTILEHLHNTTMAWNMHGVCKATIGDNQSELRRQILQQDEAGDRKRCLSEPRTRRENSSCCLLLPSQHHASSTRLHQSCLSGVSKALARSVAWIPFLPACTDGPDRCQSVTAKIAAAAAESTPELPRQAQPATRAAVAACRIKTTFRYQTQHNSFSFQ